ncbi:MAG: hypothetical protein K2P93_09495 [Alphaproteobacteria bacterium]|nr:hypothetical protein [Alphaproteobacteria bacterium]
MRALLIFFILLLPIEYVYGMGESLNLKVLKTARHTVRPLVKETLEEYGTKKPTKKNEIEIFLQWTIGSKEFVNDLNSHIILYLREGKDPGYVDCPYSFKGVSEALSGIGITLSEDRMSLTQHSQENKEKNDHLLPNVPLIRRDQPPRTPPCCCFQ